MLNIYEEPDNKKEAAGGEEKMVLRTINFDLTTWNAAKAKAKSTRTPLAVVIRHLVRLWIKGEIIVTIDEENEKKP
jgi:hypothetical protein